MGRHGRAGAERAGAWLTRPPAGGVDPSWLRLRGPADVQARTRFASGLADDLAQHLDQHVTGGVGRRVDGSAVARLVDVGAGTGAGARWLRDRLDDQLPAPQHWRLVDHDPGLLACADPTADGWAHGVVATVDQLPGLLAAEPADVVTCQALLDVLTSAEVDAMVEPTVQSGAAALLALSVTGEVAWSPWHHDDEMVAEAFDAHQRRAGRLGPDGGAYAARGLRRQGYTVTMAATPWHLGAADTDLLRAWLQGRADAAVEQSPGMGDRIRSWHESRDRQACRGELSAVVGHVDVLGLPPRPGPST
jgi:hypothetical protein